MSLRLTALPLLLLLHFLHSTTVTSKKVCGRPVLPAQLKVDVLQRVYEPGEQLVLSCEQGYISAGGSRKIVCIDQGVWTAPTLKCLPRPCPVPDQILNGRADFDDIVFLSNISYTCNEGYILTGTNSSTCLHNGQWGASPPTCKPVTCGLPKIPQFAKMTYDKKFTGNETEFGFGGKYECLPPLALFGNERAFCAANGSWTEPPKCKFVSCPPPEKIDNGFLTLAVIREHGYKERVKYGCNVDYVLDGPAEIECEKNGQWSRKPACRAPCSIGIKRGRVFYNNKKLWIEDVKPNRLLHAEMVVFYCQDKQKGCGYPEASQCIDGTLETPKCFEEPTWNMYNLKAKSLPSENLC
ncbi:beta-2-glycoprotein 1-like [Denticeps clupeoides]|uniref:Beta-2-glycoprotein 1 n=1 Tax=Denticeps clupeoides TaxID=299321 RepID=A0AAY4ACN7_9TELE|nr:beta-2-glycoprotein 1 [Denticeps clupeoides]